MAEPKYVEIAGSGRLRVTTRADVRRATLVRETAGEDIFQSQIDDFWSNLAAAGGASNPRLIERVWVVNRCIQLNAQAIATMPLRHYGPREPAWVANPDPVWYPNGIGDAVFSAVWSMYAWGDAFLYVASRYADGFPQAWTVLDPALVSVEVAGGRRRYRSGNVPLDSGNVIQIPRDPRGGLRGTSLISSYSAYANGLLASADLGRVMMGSGGTPNAVIKSKRKLTEEQATKVQEKWMTAASARRGAPAILPPELDFQQLSFSPSDLLLLDAQEFDSRVLASAAGVPALFLNLSIEGGLNYQTPVLLLEHWWRTELRPAAMRVSRALSANMLARGSYVEFDAREFLAPTFADLVKSWAELVKEGIGSSEEARVAVLNLPADQTGPALAELAEPPSAGASPSQQPASVVALRPTQAVSQ